MNSYVWSLGCLTASAGFATLYHAFTITRQAGLDRLRERFPAFAGRVSRWEKRWDTLRAALLLVHGFTQAGALAFAVAGILAPSPSAGAIVFFAAIVLISALALDLVPRALSESYADRLSIQFLNPAAVLSFFLTPLAMPFAWIERRLGGYFRNKTAERHRPTAEDAIISLVDRDLGGDLEESERKMIRGVFEMGETVVREIMTPRVDIVSVDESEPVQDCLRRIADHKYSRYPAIRDSLDAIAGAVHIKDLALACALGRGGERVGAFVKEAPFVPESMPIGDLLDLMRGRREHLAVVVDEYGGTAGLVTMEDILEELIGEIRDEFDEDERDPTAPAGDIAVVDARMPIYQLNELMRLHLPTDEDYETVGGYVVSALSRIPRKGDTIQAPGGQLTVESATARRVLRVRVERRPAAGPSDATVQKTGESG